jgi:hypothetical protein
MLEWMEMKTSPKINGFGHSKITGLHSEFACIKQKGFLKKVNEYNQNKHNIPELINIKNSKYIILLNNVNAQYRVYVKEGTTEVQVQDWTKINRTPNEYYFIFDTRDKIPNQYYVDIKVNTGGQQDTYKKQLTFQIVNKK